MDFRFIAAPTPLKSKSTSLGFAWNIAVTSVTLSNDQLLKLALVNCPLPQSVVAYLSSVTLGISPLDILKTFTICVTLSVVIPLKSTSVKEWQK